MRTSDRVRRVEVEVRDAFGLQNRATCRVAVVKVGDSQGIPLIPTPTPIPIPTNIP